MPRAKSEPVVLEDEDIETKEDESVEEENYGRIIQVVYKTNKNLGNSEHETIELTYSVNEGEDLEEAFNYVKEKALEYLGLNG